MYPADMPLLQWWNVRRLPQTVRGDRQPVRRILCPFS